MKSDFFEIQKFTDGILIVEIAIIQRNKSIYHSVLEISEIKFYDLIDENIGIG